MLLSQSEISNACNWLLQNAGPSIRYRTLTEIMHLDETNIEVRNAYDEILNSKRFQYINTKQNSNGAFGENMFHSATDSTETYLRELFEIGVRPDNAILKKGIEYAEYLHISKSEITSWIIGIYTEPIGRAGISKLVEEWFKDFIDKFNIIYEFHRNDWLETGKGYPSTYFLEIPYIYVIRTLSNSWWWLQENENYNISKVLEFLLIDMAEVSKLYWISPNNPKVSYPNCFHVVSSGDITKKTPNVMDFTIALECLWLLAEFGVVEDYPNLLNAYKFITSNKNNDGLWEFPIDGVTKSKAKWHSYHGFSIEENWRKKESPIAELTFRICLTAERNRKGLRTLIT